MPSAESIRTYCETHTTFFVSDKQSTNGNRKLEISETDAPKILTVQHTATGIVI